MKTQPSPKQSPISQAAKQLVGSATQAKVEPLPPVLQDGVATGLAKSVAPVLKVERREARSKALVVDRSRLQLDLSPAVAQLVDQVSSVLGVPKTQLVLQALLQALPCMVEQANLVKQLAGKEG